MNANEDVQPGNINNIEGLNQIKKSLKKHLKKFDETRNFLIEWARESWIGEIKIVKVRYIQMIESLVEIEAILKEHTEKFLDHSKEEKSIDDLPF